MHHVLWDGFRVVHLFAWSNFNFLHNPQWITFPTLLYSNTLFSLICCVRLLSNWSFHLYHHITYICYFVVSYLILPWYSLSLWCCMLLSGEIQFLSLVFPFLAICKFSHVRFRLSLEAFFQLFSFPFFVFWLFLYCCLYFSGVCNQSFSALVYVMFESL